VRSVGITLIVIVLVAGCCGLAYARWTRPAADADQAVADGELPKALAGYVSAEARFDWIPAAKRLFRADYDRIVSNELWVLYRLGRYDETIDRADRASEGASPHFWSACAFFQKGTSETKSDARLGWFTRAEEEFRKAAEGTPDDWDTKYDFELTTRLVAELRKQPKTPPKQLMQLLRPPTPTPKATRRVG